jgi:hypothetical protein
MKNRYGSLTGQTDVGSFVITRAHNSTDFIEVQAIVKGSYQHQATDTLAECCVNCRTSTFIVSSVSGTY